MASLSQPAQNIQQEEEKMEVVLEANGHTDVGGTPLVMHSDRLVDPLDEFNIAIAGHSGKRKKTLADHSEMSRYEFFGGMYTEPELTMAMLASTNGKGSGAVPVIPAGNILRCLQGGASAKSKDGENVKRGVHFLEDFAALVFDGPKDPVKLYQDPDAKYLLRKSVGIRGNRTMRTRPMFTDWSLELPVEIDANVFNLATVKAAWEYAGRYVGLCEMRPVYGRFVGTVREVKKGK
jgi:hypothetical protein